MTLFEIILISIGLAMDCFAVSIASSIAYGKYNWIKILRMALFFGIFQGVMPLIGWGIGATFAEQIKSVDHWLAFGILGYLGINMIWESTKHKEKKCESNPYGSISKLLLLSVATSIDALAMGFVLAPYGTLIYSSSIIIGLVSFLFTLAGCIIGITFGKNFKINVEMWGGIILILIGTKILIEHLINHGILKF